MASTMTSSILRTSRTWDFDIDRYLNRIIPPSPLHKFPTPLSRFLGYRSEQQKDVGNVMGAVWSLVGAFLGLAIVATIFNHTESISLRHPPALIASFGASAVLEYNVVQSPLGQPRNALLGHTFSALIGVGISKLFQFHSDYESIKWLAGALACGIASAFMLLTGTVHPPGGASAVLAVTDATITAMGWYFVGLVMWGTTLMLAIGLVVNNIQRQFPVYWWTPMDVRAARRSDVETMPDAKGGVECKEGDDDQLYAHDAEKISITGTHITLPGELSLNAEEAELLERLRDRLRTRIDDSDAEQSHLALGSARSSAECTAVASRSDA